MALVSAATIKRMKNIVENTCPAPPIVLNTLGSTQNTNPGPPAGSNPQLNTAGKMATPARMAISVSHTVIHMAVLKILSLTGIYEPYTSIMPMPTLSEKRACPSAARIPSPVSLEKSGEKRYSTPFTAPGSVRLRTQSTRIRTTSTGISTFDTFSIPFCTPPRTMNSPSRAKMTRKRIGLVPVENWEK